MDFTVTAKVHIKVDEVQKAYLLETMDAYRKACDYVSAYIYKTHDLTQGSVNEQLYRVLRNKYALKSQMAQSVIKTVIAKYKSMQSNGHSWSKPVFKKLQYDLVWNRDYSLVADCFSVNSLYGRLKMFYYDEYVKRYFDKSVYSFGTAKLVYRHKKFFLHIPVTCDIKVCSDMNICNVAGVDRGINFIAVSYNSSHRTSFYSGKQIKNKRAHYKALRKELQQVRTHSSRRRLKSIGQRENRWIQDVNHCVSKALVTENPSGTLFVIEDLTGVRTVTEKVKHYDRYIMVSWSYYDLELKLMYKALQYGSKVIKVDPKYTSQTCPRCGHTEKANRNKKIHLFSCKNCGYSSNDDRIGAMNLYFKGIHYLSNAVPNTEGSE